MTAYNQFIKQNEELKVNMEKLVMKLEKYQQDAVLYSDDIQNYFKKDYKIKRNDILYKIDELKQQQQKMNQYVKIQFDEQKVQKLMKELPNIINIQSHDNQIDIQQKNYYIRDLNIVHCLLHQSNEILIYDFKNGSIANMPIRNHLLKQQMNSLIDPYGQLFLFGGMEGTQISKDIYEYSFVDGKLIKLQSMPIGKIQAGYCFHNGSIYQFGGKLLNGEKTNICEKYVINENKWQPLPMMSVKRSGMGVCRYSYDDIYIFFGAEDNTVSQVIEKYNIHNQKFDLINVKNNMDGLQSIQPSAIQINDQQIMIFGGFIDGSNQQDKVLLFDVSTGLIINSKYTLDDMNIQASLPIISNNCIYSLRYTQYQQMPESVYSQHIFKVYGINQSQIRTVDCINNLHLKSLKYNKQESIN